MRKAILQMGVMLCAAIATVPMAFGDSPRAPKPVTLDEAIKLSSFIVVGEAVGIVYRDVSGRELKNDPPNPRNYVTELRVKIKNVLLNKDVELPEEVGIDYPVGVHREYFRDKYQHKTHIYFAKVHRTKIKSGDAVVVHKQLQFARGRNDVFPYPIERLDQVVKAIESYTKREQMGKM